ncbi:MAG: hypothetical protein QG673_961 [Pseudomonadota bacterium]|nr:hypothetical protein [Pseudomonadota bacterium]
MIILKMIILKAKKLTINIAKAITSPVKQRINDYDPYGVMRVNALQSLTMLIGVLLINSTYNIPYFNIVIQLPLYSCMAFPLISGYYNRLKCLLIYSAACILYAIILNLAYNYRLLTVFAVGMVIASFFYLAKQRIPQLFVMIGVIQSITYSALIIPNGGNVHQLAQLIVSLILVSALSFIFYATFPSIYFFRIWQRGIYFTLEEMIEKLKQISAEGLTSEQLSFKHLIRVQELTDNLGYKEYGFAARRISLSLISIYTTIVALANQVSTIKNDEIKTICNICQEFCQALKMQQQLTDIQLDKFSDIQNIDKDQHNNSNQRNNNNQGNNQELSRLKKDLSNMIQVWNGLCLKI